jgi:hypothetical protein
MGGRTNVNDEERSGRSSVFCGDLIKNVGKKLWVTPLHNFRSFIRISTTFKSVLYEIISVMLDCHKFRARWFPKMLTGGHKRQRHFNWELFDCPPCSPHLAPSDYHLITYPKNLLPSQRFSGNELMESVKMWLSSQAADFFVTSVQELIPRYMCLNSGGDYVKK